MPMEKEKSGQCGGRRVLGDSWGKDRGDIKGNSQGNSKDLIKPYPLTIIRKNPIQFLVVCYLITPPQIDFSELR
jgi:hypothetical protein